MRCVVASLIVLAMILVPVSVGADVSSAESGEVQTRQAALGLGNALLRSDTSLLRPLLPRHGKVRMRLTCFGPEEGSFSAGQVEAVFSSFFRHGAVKTFDLIRLESDESGRFALAQGRVSVIDRDGRRNKVDIHLTFEPEEGRWVLRGIRESQP